MDPGTTQLNQFAALAAAFGDAADPDRAAPMAKYMKNHFAFFGLPSPVRRAIQREVLGRWAPDDTELVEFVDSAWAAPEREFQYAACDVVARRARHCSPDRIDDLERWITTRSWWDTVDALAHGVGDLVAAHPELGTVMDRWVDADDFWLARVAITHQLRFKAATDTDRLFRSCTRRAADPEFFIRKAIGWALREYAKTDPDAVLAYVRAHETELSPLSRREALRRIAGV